LCNWLPNINLPNVLSPGPILSVTIDSIHEVCEGKKSEIFQRYADNRFDPNCCFSIYYGERVKSLDLVSTNGEEARTWITGLKYLMAGISDEDCLARRQRTRDQYPPNIPLVYTVYIGLSLYKLYTICTIQLYNVTLTLMRTEWTTFRIPFIWIIY